MKNLTSLANEYGTDKGTKVGNAHGYTVVYDRLFAPLRHKPISILEIGLSIGGPEHGNSAERSVENVPSVRLWQSYFTKAHIYGLDISDCSAFANERFSFFRVDCGDRDALRKVAEAGIVFDIIIDDGSHASFHQQLTLMELFPALASGGLYVIEDLDWQPTVYEKSLPPVPKTAELLTSTKDAWWEGLKGLAQIQTYTRDQLRRAAPFRQRKFHLGRIVRDFLGIPSKNNPMKLAILTKAVDVPGLAKKSR